MRKLDIAPVVLHADGHMSSCLETRQIQSVGRGFYGAIVHAQSSALGTIHLSASAPPHRGGPAILPQYLRISGVSLL